MLIDISRLSQGKRFVFIHRLQNGEDEEIHSGSFGFSEYPRESMKLKLKEEQERAIKEFDFGVN